MQWVQDPKENKVPNLSNMRHEASRHFRKEKKEYLKGKIDEIETDSKTKYIRVLYRGSLILRRVTSPEII